MPLTTNDFGNFTNPPFSGVSTEQIIKELRDRIDELENRQECARCGEVRATLYVNFVKRNVDGVALTEEEWNKHGNVWMMCHVLEQYSNKIAEMDAEMDKVIEDLL